MNTSALAIILLGFWVFLLRNRIKRLEGIVEEMRHHFAKNTPIQEEKVKDAVEEKAPLLNNIVEKTYDAENNVTIIEEKKTRTIKKILLAKPIMEVDVEKSTKSIEKKKEIIEQNIPKEPSKILIFIKDYFNKGNLLVRIGAIILFFGLAFLVKYAIAESIIGIEVRLGFVAFVSIVLIALGWKLRERKGAYGQILQGLGIAILYLLIYATAKFYTLLSLDTAFLLMLGVVILGSTLAILEDALPLALFATAGGFLVPILTSSGEGSHIMLFSYYALLNLGIFAVAWYRSWRLLNILGFFFTFIISASWGLLKYTPESFASTEPFLLLYFVMYLSISILFTVKHPYKPKNLVDATLVFGLPIIAFPQQLTLISSFEYGSTLSAIVLGLLYLGLYYFLKNTERTKLLAQSFLALAVLFLTISVPYLFDANVSAALWSLESAGIIWLALRQDKKYSRYFGQFLLLIAIFSYPSSVETFGVTFAEYLGYIILISAVFISAYILDTYRPKLHDIDRVYSKVILIMGIVLWFVSMPSQLSKLDVASKDLLLWSLILFIPIALVIIKYSKWQLLTRYLALYFPLGVLFSLPRILTGSHPFEGLGALYLALFVSIGYALLYYQHRIWQYVKEVHSLLLWFIVMVFFFESFYHINLLFSYTIIAFSEYLGYLSISILLFISAYFLDKFKENLYYLDRHIPKIFVALALVLYFASTSSQLMRFEMLYDYEMLGSFLFASWLIASIRKRITWQILDYILQGYFALGVFFFITILVNVPHPFQDFGGILFLAFILLHYILLYRYDKTWKINTILHIASLWFITIIGIVEFLYLSQVYSLDSSMTSILIVTTPLVFNSIILYPPYYQRWLEPYRSSYQLIGSAGLIVFLFVWTFTVFAIASPSSQGVIPLLNLLDITQILVLVSLYYWMLKNKRILSKERRTQLYAILLLLIIIFINVMFSRGIHTFTNVPYSMSYLWHNGYFQTGLSILWSMIAIILMLLSKTYHNRPLWIAGFGLLILIVLKLFFIELAQSGTIERIISFMVVGTLLLVIGYFVPLPPNKEDKHVEES